MGLGDKTKHTAEELVGKAKRNVGKAFGDEDLEARGIAEEATAKGKKVVDDVVEAVKRTDDDPEGRG
jgi:uncharacterized protein YjbJ (UPF0337 family)